MIQMIAQQNPQLAEQMVSNQGEFLQQLLTSGDDGPPHGGDPSGLRGMCSMNMNICEACEACLLMSCLSVKYGDRNLSCLHLQVCCEFFYN